ncbi:MAG TPA: class 1 fructose-bisphosphatase [Rhodocyclaceae bacterium]
MHDGRTTLTQFIIEEQRRVKGATGDFSALLNDVATACKSISHAISRGCLGAGSEDPQIFLEHAANDYIVNSNIWTGRLAGMASENTPDITPIPAQYPRGKYLLVFDPLNGSGNLDINFMTGTIFSVLRAPAGKRDVGAADFLQPGCKMAAAGFVLYGASTRLVLTTGNGVNGFMLDNEIGEFVLTHKNITIPDDANTFAINASNERFWEPPVRRYVDECLAGKTGPRGRDFGMRWVASLIAEAYRILTRGGVFLYPVDEKTRSQGGRLGLIYEANPIAYIIEQAGGGAITGRNRILDVTPSELHQRAPFIFGSKSEVDRLYEYHKEYVEGRDHESYDLPLFSNRSLFRHE